jgi:hypothetical protein
MKQIQFLKYIKLLVFITLLLIILVGGFNWLVDPYAIYGSPKIAGFNALKPEEMTHTNMCKAYAIQQLKPQSVILGTSTVEQGIDPDHKGWAFEPVYNVGLPAANIYTLLRYLQHANAIQPLKQVVIGLEFQTFNIHDLTTDDATEARLSVAHDGEKNSSFRFINDIVPSLFSVDALLSSINTVRQKKEIIRIKDNGMYEFTGQDPANLNGYLGINSYHGIFVYEEGSYVKNSDSWQNDFQFSSIGADKPPFTYYREMLQFAYSNNIDLRMFISPSHARLWELFANFGLSPKIEEWKHILVTINEEEARNYGKEPFSLWDFSGYNEFTTEAVPQAGDTQTMMRWFIDPRHYSKELGDMILDRIFDYIDPGRLTPDYFGVLLNSENIDSVLEKIRTDRENYRNTHPEDVAEIEALFK